jgi:Tol biopolymer transport system component
MIPEREIWVMKPDGSERQMIARVRLVGSPVWSPKGDIVFTGRVRDQDGIWILAPNGMKVRKLSDHVGLSLSWSPDGNWIAFEAERDLWIMKSDGTDPRNITDSLQVQEFAPVWSPH